MFAGIEAGGTKFVCGIGTGPDDLTVASFPTTDPQTTIGQVVAFFRSWNGEPLKSIGIGSFGPIDLRPSSPTFGYITETPKIGWRNFDLCGAITAALNLPLAFDTDVNAALLGESKWGAVAGVHDAIYITIGTGIGGGALSGGRLVHGLIHPEMGHLCIPHDLARDPYPGHCPFHGDCLEGLASGSALKARWQTEPSTLPADHPAWALEAHYIALGLVNLMLTLSPERIIIGGGVASNAHLFPLIRAEFARLLNSYLVSDLITKGLDTLIQPPRLGGRAGVLGTIALAQEVAGAPQ